MHLKEIDANLVVVLDVLLIDASVTKAAQRLGRSPSAVSHALSNLRELFNDELFVRAGQRLVPTAKAKEIAPAVHVIVAGMEGLLRPMEPFNPDSEEREFTVSCPVEFELTLLHELRRMLGEEAPGIVVNRSVTAGTDKVEEMRHGAIHYSISENPTEDSVADIVSEHLFDDRLVTVAAKNHDLSKKPASLAKFAATEHIVVSDGSDMSDALEGLLNEKGREPNFGVKVSSVLAGAIIAARSDGLLTLPHSVAKSVMGCVPLIEIKQPFATPTISYFLSWHRSNDRDQCHVWLRHRMTEMIKDI